MSNKEVEIVVLIKGRGRRTLKILKTCMSPIISNYELSDQAQQSDGSKISIEAGEQIRYPSKA